MKPFNLIFAALILLTWSCTQVKHISSTKVSWDVPSEQVASPTAIAIDSMVVPYKKEVDAEMNSVIVNLSTDLVKEQPESNMGNLVTDAMLYAINHDGLHADFAVCNYGGMRVPSITQGPLTIGEVFELLPFDNIMVIVDVPGALVDSLFSHMASRSGWPVSKGVEIITHDKKVVSSSVMGQPVDPNKTYKVVMPDYVANGGDEASFLIPLGRFQTKYLQRDAFIQYAAETARNGNDLTASREGRFRNQ